MENYNINLNTLINKKGENKMEKEFINEITKKNEKVAIIKTNKNKEIEIDWNTITEIITIMVYQPEGHTTYYID